MPQIRTRQLLGSDNRISTGIYGSRAAARFVAEAVNNTASLDCLWVGDSNTGYNGWGWASGFQHGLCQAGSNMYATTINLPYNAQPRIGYRSQIFSSYSAATGVVSGIGASSGASNVLKATYSIGSGGLSATGGGTYPAIVPPDFADVPNPRAAFSSTALWIYMRRIQSSTLLERENCLVEPCPIGINAELNFRAQINIRSGGSFSSKILKTAGSTAPGTPPVKTTNTTSLSADVWDTHTHTISAADRFIYVSQSYPQPVTPAISLNAEYIRIEIDGGGVGPSTALFQGTSAGFCSLYRNIIGTSSSIMEYRGGATLTDLATDVSQAAGGFCKTLLKEARERQIAAGGTGRVLLCIQGGVNNSDWSPSNPQLGIDKVESIKTSIKTQWAALGYPATDLYFLFMVSHPVEAGDTNLGILRTAAQAYYTNSTDTLFVNLNEIAPYEKILLSGWYQWEPNKTPVPGIGYEHLGYGGRGYETISSMIVSNICRFV